jgi:putative redox protein
MIEAKVKWIGGMQFVGKTASGHALLMDTSSKIGGENTAPTPMELLLVALGGCTGMDVVSILQKMRVKFEDLEIEVSGERRADHPRVYKKIALRYKVKGRNLTKEKVKRAVELSQKKYCSISEMLKSTAKISYTIEIEKDT